MGVLRRAGRRTYLKLPNGKDVHVPNITATHHRQYRVIGVKVKTLKDLQKGLDGGMRVEMWGMYNGEVEDKSLLNHETGNWERFWSLYD